MFRGRLIAIAAVACVGASVIAATASARPADVSFVRVIRATQAPYQPVAFRVWVKAPVDHQIMVAIKIFDAAGHTVYTAPGVHSPAEAVYSQPYYSSSLTLKWNKVADDGSRLPRGQQLMALAFATDLDTDQKLFRSSPYRFTVTS
jgi:hypothetical protein